MAKGIESDLVRAVHRWVALLWPAFLVASCGGSISAPQPAPIAPEPAPEPPPPEAAVLPDQPAQRAATPAAPAPIQPASPAEEPPAPQPPAGSNEPFAVTQEMYSRTFEEVESFIQRLNEIIQRRDFDTWQAYLSASYRSRVGDPDFLAGQSEQALLKKNDIRLKSLQDYFGYVVVPSRSGVHLDDIEFIDQDHVKAISIIHNTRGVLYLLVREEGQWKIGVW